MAQAARIQDDVLMTRIARKDARSFSVLYSRYNSVLVAKVLPILRTRAEAEEVVQEVFMEIWKSASDFDDSRSVAYGWLVTIARNKAIDRLRSKARANLSVDASSIAGDTSDSPLKLRIEEERRSNLRVALSQLPSEQRELIATCYFDGLSQRDASTRLGIPLGTVKTRMRLGLAKLESLLAAI